MNSPQAYFLVTHGSSDRRSWLALQELVALAGNRVNAIVGGGCLEGQPLRLAQQLQQLGKDALASGCTNIWVVPLFLLEGVHVQEDIPAELAIARQSFGNSLEFRLTQHLGSHPQIPTLLQNKFAEIETGQGFFDSAARVIISHGSRRPNANQAIEELARSLGAIATYWSVPQSVEVQVEQAIARGVKQIAVVPYFLFEGVTTEAIAAMLADYSASVKIDLTSVPIAPNQIASLALELPLLLQS